MVKKKKKRAACQIENNDNVKSHRGCGGTEHNISQHYYTEAL